MKYKRNKNSGFTLIELLTTISIIGLLSTILLASVSSARITARDSARVQNTEQISKAIELYYSDHGVYPPITTYTQYPSFSATLNIPGGGGGGQVSWNELAGLLSPYTASIPPVTTSYNYYYFASGTQPVCVSFGSGTQELISAGYMIAAMTERSPTAALSDGGISDQYFERAGGAAVPGGC